MKNKHVKISHAIVISVLSFLLLAIVFGSGYKKNIFAYFIYAFSAYSLVLWILKLKQLLKMCHLIQKIQNSKYIQNTGIRIFQGMVINFVYMIFRVVLAIQYHSVWFISMAAYYMVLGGLRAYLIFCFNKKVNELYCYKQTTKFLFLLNIPMGGMILLMIHTNLGYSYPGYIIYGSAFYTFYSMGISIYNLVKYYNDSNYIVKASKILNFISAMMSILGLQTAMIARFSNHGENYRRLMNSITGGCVYGVVIVVACIMLVKKKKGLQDE